MTQTNVNQLIQTFNTSTTALVISGWPDKGKKGKNHGIAWYTKQSISPIAKKFNQKFVVLAEKNHDNSPQLAVQGNILILRVFDRTNKRLYPQILFWLKQFSNIHNVYVHSEFGMNGSIWHFGLLVPFLALIKMMRKDITFFSHNVIDDVTMLAGHLNLKPDSFFVKFLNLGLRAYYYALALLCNRIVVLDSILKTRLEQFVPAQKIIFTPIPVQAKKSKFSQAQAKKMIGIKPNEKVLLYFGFATWYKGADWLIKQFNQQNQDTKQQHIHLVVAGGPSYSLQSKPYYQQYYQELETIAAQNPFIHLTGFVKETDIAQYFSAADLVVFPYRGLMGASGCLTHALSYHKPFMVSQPMSEILTVAETQERMKTQHITLPQLSFTITKTGFDHILRTIQNQPVLKKAHHLAQDLSALRHPSHCAYQEYQMVYGNVSSTLVLQTKNAIVNSLPY